MAVVQQSSKTKVRTYTGSTYVPASIDTYVATGQRKMPWSVIGTDLNQSTGMKAKDALAAIGMDLEVTKRPLAFIAPDGTTQTIPGWNGTGVANADTPGGFDLWGFPVGDGYTIVQPAEGLGFLDTIVDEHDGAHYSTAWSMREKRMLGITLEFPERIIVDPGGAADELGVYGLGTNSFDGSSAFRFAVTTVRFWCMNQLNPTIARAARSISMKHTAGIKGRVQEAREALGITMGYIEALDEEANALYQQAMTDRQFANIVKDVFPITADTKDRTRVTMQANRDAIHELWAADHNANVTGTRWGAYNVLAEYADWGRAVRKAPTGWTGDRTEGIERMRAIGTMVNWPTARKAQWFDRLVAA
jgi:phage/plasmid-like protein (TIGR03299 family)